MNFDLSDDHRLIQETVRDFARSEVAPVAEELDREKARASAPLRAGHELDLVVLYSSSSGARDT